MSHALLFSVSGQRGTGRTDLYQKLRHVTRERFPEHTFAFLGNPLRTPCPLLWNARQRALPPTTKLFLCWAKLDNFAVKKLAPALQTHDVVITDGFGLDALLYATAHSSCANQNRHASSLHHQCVNSRLLVQSIKPPEYFIARADIDTVDAWMLKKWPALSQVAVDARRAFIRYEEGMITDYFLNPAQFRPHPLDASLSVNEMCERALAIIAERLQQQQGRKVA